MARRITEPGGPRLIKRYGNRRLYDTVEHRCISRDELLGLARSHIEFVVRDARTDEDLTQPTLMALLTEGAGAVSEAMPIEFLRELASLQQQAVRDFFQSHLPAAFRAYVELGRKAGVVAPADPASDGELGTRPPEPLRSRRGGARGKRG